MDATTILLVDDSSSFARTIRAMMSLCPLQTRFTEAQYLAKALKLLEQQKFDLVLLDLTLPDSFGLDTLRALRQSTSTPVIVLTGVDDEQNALEALKLGAEDYLLKGDINSHQLNRSISYALERHRAHRLEVERLRLYEQREDFMATLTHDLKNPLIGANRILELVCEAKIEPAEVSPLLQQIRGSNNALLAMIRNLVEVYRYEKDVDTLIRENTDLNSVVARYLHDGEPLLNDRQVMVTRNIHDENLAVYADKNALLRVVQNLVENAIKFSPPKTAVEISLWRDNHVAMMQVSDQGPGIAPGDKARLFQRFWQGRSGRQFSTGTGLGLYLCRQIVEAHEGKIWCDSAENSGAKFIVSLPLAS